MRGFKKKYVRHHTFHIPHETSYNLSVFLPVIPSFQVIVDT
jgi:hypothetical protein